MNVVFEELTKYIEINKKILGMEIEYRNSNGNKTKNPEKIEHIAIKRNNLFLGFLNTKGLLDIPNIDILIKLKKEELKPKKYLREHFNIEITDKALRIFPVDINNTDITHINFSSYLLEYLRIFETLSKI